MDRSKKMIIIVLIIVFMVGLLMSLWLVPITPHWRSEEYHTKRVTALAKKRYVDSGKCTEIEVYPIYNDNEELTHFVIEMQPSGFAYVSLMSYTVLTKAFGGGGMYRCSSLESLGDFEMIWSHLRVYENGKMPIGDSSFDENGVVTVLEGDVFWKKTQPEIITDFRTGRNISPVKYGNADVWYETDSNGEFVFQTESPYKVCGIGKEKRYMLKVKDGYIPAIRDGEKYFNLLTLQTFVWEGSSMRYVPAISISAYASKTFDL